MTSNSGDFGWSFSASRRSAIAVIELPLLDPDRRAEPQASCVAPVFGKYISNNRLGGGVICLGNVEFSEFGLRLKLAIRRASGRSQVLQLLRGVVNFAVREIKLRQRHLIGENVPASLYACREFGLGGGRALGVVEKADDVESGFAICGVCSRNRSKLFFCLVKLPSGNVGLDQLVSERGLLGVFLDQLLKHEFRLRPILFGSEDLNLEQRAPASRLWYRGQSKQAALERRPDPVDELLGRKHQDCIDISGVNFKGSLGFAHSGGCVIWFLHR